MSDPITPITSPLPASLDKYSAHKAALQQVAQELEASFLTEMLKHASFGESRCSFGGGVGEEQFASLLRAEHARALVERGGIGLAQSLYTALLARGDQEGGANP